MTQEEDQALLSGRKIGARVAQPLPTVILHRRVAATQGILVPTPLPRRAAHDLQDQDAQGKNRNEDRPRVQGAPQGRRFAACSKRASAATSIAAKRSSWVWPRWKRTKICNSTTAILKVPNVW